MLIAVATRSEAETRQVGAALASTLRVGDVVGIDGDLGVGKTRLVQGLVSGLGGSIADVTSPTFTLLHEYATDPPLTHADAYRLADSDEFLALGISEQWEDGIVVVEWADRVADALPRSAFRFRGAIDATTGDHRFEIRDPRADRLRPFAHRLRAFGAGLRVAISDEGTAD